MVEENVLPVAIYRVGVLALHGYKAAGGIMWQADASHCKSQKLAGAYRLFNVYCVIACLNNRMYAVLVQSFQT